MEYFSVNSKKPSVETNAVGIDGSVRAVSIRTNLLHDYEFYCFRRKHGDAETWKAFVRAINGEQNAWSRFIRVNRSRRAGSYEFLHIRKIVFERDHWTCVYCGTTDGPLECDHKIPISKGGDDSFENLATACQRCNREKYDKTVEEWRAKVGKNAK